MIGQVSVGCSFGGAVRYVTGKAEAEVLDTEGLSSDENSSEIAKDINNIRTLKPNVKNGPDR